MTNSKEITREERIVAVENRIKDFSEWLTSEYSLPKKVVKEYIDGIKNCSKYSVQYEIIDKSLFEINNKDIISKCKAELFVKPVFKKLDERANNLFAKAMDKYYLFIKEKDK